MLACCLAGSGLVFVAAPEQLWRRQRSDDATGLRRSFCQAAARGGIAQPPCHRRGTAARSHLRHRFVRGLTRPATRAQQVARRGFFEPIILGVMAWYYATKPKTAPGAEDRQKLQVKEARQEEIDARKDVEAASESEKDAAIARLEEAEQATVAIEAVVEKAELDLKAYPVPDYLKASRRAGKVNVGVTGGSGVGKSSWINSIRRLRAHDPGAAPTGILETTTKPEMYRFGQHRKGVILRALGNVIGRGQKLRRALLRRDPDDEPIQVGDQLMLRNIGKELDGQEAEVVQKMGSKWKVKLQDGSLMEVASNQVTGVLAECVLWDLPGVGTPKFPQATYLKEMGIRHFDIIVLITASRFTEAELMLLEELRQWEVPFFMVRNKADIDIECEVERAEEMAESDSPLANSEKEVVKERTVQCIKDYFLKELDLEPIYVISTKAKLREDFDFLRLEHDIDKAIHEQRMVEIDAKDQQPVVEAAAEA